jgi:hypothetical protein
MIQSHSSKQRHTLPLIGLSLVLTLFQTCATWGSGQRSQVLKADEHKRLEASICPDSMNRIAVANDRITQIFGDEGTFENQSDEATGQVFLKPTAENGPKSLSLTLITEQGVTQDLTLHPTAKSPKTLILTRDPASREALGANSGAVPSQNPSFPEPPFQQSNLDSRGEFSSFRKTLPIQEELLTVLKQAIMGQLPRGEEEWVPYPPSSVSAGYSITLDQSWQIGPYVIHALLIENTTPTPLELQEKDFYQSGDLALNLSRRILAPQGKTTLYVVKLQNPESRSGGLS